MLDTTLVTWTDEDEEAEAAMQESIARQQREFDDEQALRRIFADVGDSEPLNIGAYEPDRPKRVVPMIPCSCTDPECLGERPDPTFEHVDEWILEPGVTPHAASSSKGRSRHKVRTPTQEELARRFDEQTAYRRDYGAERVA